MLPWFNQRNALTHAAQSCSCTSAWKPEQHRDKERWLRKDSTSGSTVVLRRCRNALSSHPFSTIFTLFHCTLHASRDTPWPPFVKDRIAIGPFQRPTYCKNTSTFHFYMFSYNNCRSELQLLVADKHQSNIPVQWSHFQYLFHIYTLNRQSLSSVLFWRGTERRRRLLHILQFH